MKKIIFLLTLSFIASNLEAKDKPTWEDYLGKWNLTLANSKSSFRSCSLVLAGTPENHSGELVWRWGSAWKFEGSDIVSISEDGTLSLKKRGFKEPLKLKIYGDGIEGSVLQGNTRHIVVGEKAKWHANPAGSWVMTVHKEDGTTDSGGLEIEEIAPGFYRGKGTTGDGDEVKVKDIEVNETQLSLKALLPNPDGDDYVIKIKGELTGDTMKGKLYSPRGDEFSLDFTAKRKRTWSKPISLLKNSGTGGWHARDLSRPFKWTCKDGVLSNGKKDVDIVSDAQFKDFKLNIQYKVDRANANSGIYLRGRYEVQIIGNDKVGKHGNCAVYSRLPPKANNFTGAGKWQNLEITFIDRYLTVVLNGVVAQDNVKVPNITGGAVGSAEHLAGPFILQGDHGEVHFRKMEVSVPK